MVTERTGRGRRHRGLALFALLPLLTGCIASNVLEAEDRAVVLAHEGLEWSEAPHGLAGLWESVAIEGPDAAQLLKIYYHFEADPAASVPAMPGPEGDAPTGLNEAGSYTAAALVLGGEVADFQTLRGTWSHEDHTLKLDGAEPLTLRFASAHVRLDATTGSVVLRRVELR